MGRALNNLLSGEASRSDAKSKGVMRPEVADARALLKKRRSAVSASPASAVSYRGRRRSLRARTDA